MWINYYVLPANTSDGPRSSALLASFSPTSSLSMSRLTSNISRLYSRQIYPLRPFEPSHLRRQESTQQQISNLRRLNSPSQLPPLHAQIITSGLFHNLPLSNRLISSYSSFGLKSDALKVFLQIPNKNIYSWTILISGFTKNGLFVEAADAFSEMVTSGIFPNEVTIATVLPALANLRLVNMGKSVHCLWIRLLFGHNVVVETSLVDMYCQFGCMDTARQVFDRMLERNLISWNVFVSGYATNGMGNDAIRTFGLMQKNGVFPDYYTIMSLTSASLSAKYCDIGPAIHGFTIRIGYGNEMQIQTALMNMYICSNLADDAYTVFKEISSKDVVAWTLMFEGFSRGQFWAKATQHFNEMMQVHNQALDSIAITSILSSCRNSGALRLGRRVHALVIKAGFTNDVFVGSALIDMYANWGEIANGKKLFEGMEEKDVVCWNAVISATGMNGYGIVAIDLFRQMIGLGIKPNDSTFVSLLCACSHSGMVQEGLKIFNHMIDRWGLYPNMQHCACIVDLLGRAGWLEEAVTFMNKISVQPHFGMYGALLSACKLYGDIKIGSQIFRKLRELNSTDAGHFSSLSNMYASLGNHQGVELNCVLLRSNGLKKDPGFSSIEMNGKLCIFMAGERTRDTDWVVHSVHQKIEDSFEVNPASVELS